MAAARKLSTQKREAILAAAVEGFQAKGYQYTSMDTIAERAAVSKRTIYNHFANKEELFKVISIEMLGCISEATNFPYDDMENLEAQLIEIGMLESEMLLSDHFIKLARVMLAECIRSPEMAREIFAELQRCESGIMRWIKEAAEAGRLKVEDPIHAAEQFLSLIKGFLFWPQLVASAPIPDDWWRRRIVESAVRMFLDRYKINA